MSALDRLGSWDSDQLTDILGFTVDFLQVLSKLSQASLLKFFGFSNEWKLVFMARGIPKGGGCAFPS